MPIEGAIEFAHRKVLDSYANPESRKQRKTELLSLSRKPSFLVRSISRVLQNRFSDGGFKNRTGPKLSSRIRSAHYVCAVF